MILIGFTHLHHRATFQIKSTIITFEGEAALSDSAICNVFVLTDTPGIYGNELNHRGSSPIFINDIDALLTRLKDVPMAGLVLEVTKVMNASRANRDRLFNYAGIFPVLRTKINPRHGFVTYLDPKDAFLHNLEAAMGKRDRNHQRVQVNIPCSVSAEDDPSMAKAVEANILDISPGGCFIQSTTPVSEPFVHLKIPSLSSSRPIYSSVRWARNDGDISLRGLGVMFIDLTDEQLADIQSIQA